MADARFRNEQTGFTCKRRLSALKLVKDSLLQEKEDAYIGVIGVQRGLGIIPLESHWMCALALCSQAPERPTRGEAVEGGPLRHWALHPILTAPRR